MLSLPSKAAKAPNGYNEMGDIPFLEPHMVFHQLCTNIGLDVPPGKVRNSGEHTGMKPRNLGLPVYGDGARILDDGTKIVGLFVSMPAVWRPPSSRFALVHMGVRRTQAFCAVLYPFEFDLGISPWQRMPSGPDLDGVDMSFAECMPAHMVWQKMLSQLSHMSNVLDFREEGTRPLQVEAKDPCTLDCEHASVFTLSRNCAIQSVQSELAEMVIHLAERTTGDHCLQL